MENVIGLNDKLAKVAKWENSVMAVAVVILVVFVAVVPVAGIEDGNLMAGRVCLRASI